MLNFAEELVLLLLRDEDGRVDSVPGHAWELALAGAVLMDLALRNKIDTDLEKLVVLDSEPVGDPVLNPLLTRISEAGDTHDVQYWIGRFRRNAATIHQHALESLRKKNILEAQQDHRFLWVFRSRRYPMRDVRAARQVKLHILSTLFSDVIPDPRDIALISLADACHILPHLLSRRGLNGCQERIDQIRKMDLIGRTVTKAVRDIEQHLATSMMHP